MKFLLIVIAVLANIHGTVFARSFLPKLHDRIIGGTPIEISEVPYQVALLLYNQNAGTYYYSCAGVIVSSTVILTVANCVNSTQASDWKVRTASTYHNSGGQVIDVARFVQHSKFEYLFPLNNDIALVHLSSPIVFSQNATRANLPFPGQTAADGTFGTISGWGSLTIGGNIQDRLYKATVPVVNQDECYAIYYLMNPVTKNMICAGWLRIGGQDSCNGDRGSPLVINGVVFGLVSWGLGCGLPNYPSVYTRVPMYMSWINSNM